MQVKKGQAFAAVHFTLSIMATMAVYLGATKELWPGIIAGMVANVTTYLGANVADNGVKGKFYEPRLEGE